MGLKHENITYSLTGCSYLSPLKILFGLGFPISFPYKSDKKIEALNPKGNLGFSTLFKPRSPIYNSASETE
ncbi:hypothetical protein L1887_03460 [Cichorium endivia]|nr:hypothetical protein L1887_03460 [Cichorium endivia]